MLALLSEFEDVRSLTTQGEQLSVAYQSAGRNIFVMEGGRVALIDCGQVRQRGALPADRLGRACPKLCRCASCTGSSGFW